MMNGLASLLQQVHLFGRDEDDRSASSSLASDDSSGVLCSSGSSNHTVKSASQPIPKTNNLTHNLSDGSLDSLNYENSYSEISSTYDSSISTEEFIIPPVLEDEQPYPAYSEPFIAQPNDELDIDFSCETRQNKNSQGDTQELREIPLSEVSQHDMFHDCWIVFYDKVYDVTNFMYEHPGGDELMMEHAGRDGTLAFRSVGHSKAALRSLEKYLIGILPTHERIFDSWRND